VVDGQAGLWQEARVVDINFVGVDGFAVLGGFVTAAHDF